MQSSMHAWERQKRGYSLLHDLDNLHCVGLSDPVLITIERIWSSIEASSSDFDEIYGEGLSLSEKITAVSRVMTKLFIVNNIDKKVKNMVLDWVFHESEPFNPKYLEVSNGRKSI